MRKLDWDSKLKQALIRDKANCNEEHNNISRDDNITFICNCGNSHTSDVRRICQTTGAFCITCTKKRKETKREETSMEKFGVKCNLQKISDESEQKRMNTRQANYVKENKKDNTCHQCNSIYNSTSPKSIFCRSCQQINNVKKRKKDKSKCIFKAIRQLGAKYSEITNSQLLIDKFEEQNKCCFWCECEFQCPKLNDTPYENNYNKPTLDRIDNDNKLHTIDNVNITCHMCNIMRGGTSYKMFEEIILILRGNKSTLDLTNHNSIYLAEIIQDAFKYYIKQNCVNIRKDLQLIING